MKVQKWLIFLVICVMLLATGCAGETVADSGSDANRDDKKISTEVPNEPIAEIAEWQAAVGDWEDENGLGYTMSVIQNETDMLFSISYMPHGGVTLEWMLPCKLVPESETLRYDQGIMTYTEAITGDSSVEISQIGGFSLSSDQNILCWYDGPEEDADPINFVRTQSGGNTEGPSDAEIAETLAEVIMPFIAVPGSGTSFEWNDSSHTSGVATVYPQSAIDGAFTISGYISIAMVQQNDGSWAMQFYDSENCSISYNYADEYFDDAGIQGFYLESEVFLDGYAWTNVTTLNFAGGSDPTGPDLTCYWDTSPAGIYDGAAYVLQDVEDLLVIYFDAQMKPISFNMSVFD